MDTSTDLLRVVSFNMCSPPTLRENKNGNDLSSFETSCAATGAVACQVILAQGNESKAGQYTKVPIGPKKIPCLLTHDGERTERVINYVTTLADQNDVVCLQEVNTEYKSKLEEHVKSHDLGFHFTMVEGNKHGTAIIYKKTALSDVQHSNYLIEQENKGVKTSKIRSVAAIEGCTATGKTVRIASAHLFGYESKSADHKAITHIMNDQKSISWKMSEIFFWVISFGCWQPKPSITIIGADTNVQQKKFEGTESYNRIDVPQDSLGGLYVDVDALPLDPSTPLSCVLKPAEKSVCALLVSSSAKNLPKAKDPAGLGFGPEERLSDHAPVAAKFSF